MPDASLQYIPLKKSGAVLPPFGAAFSPDGRYLICPRIDERRVKPEPFIEQVPTDGSMRPVVHELRRAFTGDQAQTAIDWFAFDISTGARSRIQLTLGCSPSQMLGNDIPGWSIASSKVFILENRVASASPALIRVDSKIGKT